MADMDGPTPPRPDRLAALLAFYEQDPGDAFTCFALAQEYDRRGQPEQAAAFYERLVEAQPEYTGTYYHLGKLYERLGRREEALAVYRRGIEVCRRVRQLKDLSELQDALLAAEGVGWDD